MEEELLQLIRTMFADGVDGVIVSDYAKGVVTERVAQELLALSVEHNVPLAADVKPSRVKFFKGATFMSPNLKEGHEFVGLSHLEQKQDWGALAKKLSEEFSTDIYLTLGADGVYVATEDGTAEHVAQEHTAEVFDVSGAGDTFITSVLLSLLCGATPVEAGKIGNAAGSVVVQKVGSVGLSATELIGVLSHEHA